LTRGALAASLRERAWAIRSRNFAPTVRFVYPSGTGVVSTTGRRCELGCAHCGGHYLRGMLTVEQALTRARGTGPPCSWLVSGGCDRRGRVPVLDRPEILHELGRSARLVLHLGLVEEDEASRLEGLDVVVALDLVGDRETAREVMGLDAGLEDYLRSYRLLGRYARVVPHLCIGLHGGRLRGERAVLEALAHEGAGELVFLVFIPTPGTAYAEKSPPPLDEVAELLAEARERFPRAHLTLGCMRPGGRYREELDELALRLGVNAIVVPTPAAEQAACRLGLTVLRGEECCVLR